MQGQDVELILTEQETVFLPPYQRLLGDAMRGIDLFGRQDIVDAQWRIVEPILDEAAPPIPYARESWGPEEADQLIGSDGCPCRKSHPHQPLVLHVPGQAFRPPVSFPAARFLRCRIGATLALRAYPLRATPLPAWL